MNANTDKLPLPRSQVILRIVGAVLLACCALMAILGTTVLSSWLIGPRFLLYWLACMLLTIAALAIALWDMLLLRRISNNTRRELFQRQFMRGDLRRKQEPDKSA